MTSLRRTLVLRTALAMGVVLILSGALLFALFRGDLRRQLDHRLADRASGIASVVTRVPGGLELDLADLDMAEFEAVRGLAFLEIWGADGTVLYRSPSLRGEDLPRAPATPSRAVTLDVDLPDDRDGRALLRVFYPLPETDGDADPKRAVQAALPLTLALAQDTESLERLVARFVLVLAGVILLSVLVTATTLSAVVSRGLRPVDALTRRIAALGDRDLDRRLPNADVPGELQPVVERLNELLARLDAAFRREKAFSADAAHELRTPLAGLRATLEVTLSRERDAESYRQTLEEALALAERLQGLVESLLSLARLDAGSVVLDPQDVELSAALERAWVGVAERAAERGLRLNRQGIVPCAIRSDPGLLDAVLRNALDNAVSYADPGGEVQLSCTPDGSGGARLQIANTGCQLDQDEAETLRDRFRRGDPARSEAAGHVGLGLPLLYSIVPILGGSVTLRAERGGRYELVISLPAAAGEGGDP